MRELWVYSCLGNGSSVAVLLNSLSPSLFLQSTSRLSLDAVRSNSGPKNPWKQLPRTTEPTSFFSARFYWRIDWHGYCQEENGAKVAITFFMSRNWDDRYSSHVEWIVFRMSPFRIQIRHSALMSKISNRNLLVISNLSKTMTRYVMGARRCHEIIRGHLLSYIPWMKGNKATLRFSAAMTSCMCMRGNFIVPYAGAHPFASCLPKYATDLARLHPAGNCC